MDLSRIRAELNELPFTNGEREVFVGNLSEMFREESAQAIAGRVSELEEDLRRHSLRASRRGEAQDALFVCQELRSLAPDFSGMAEAIRWTSRITAVALEMVLPGVAGLWFDNRFGTGFLSPLGFALGVAIGVRCLTTMSRGKHTSTE